MKPIMLNSNGSLMRKCEEYGQPLLCGPQYQVYNFYVVEGVATNGDGTVESPWNDINNAFNSNTYALCQFACTRVYIHVDGEITHGIGGSLAGEWGTKNYQYRLIFVPRIGRVAVNPGNAYILVGTLQASVVVSRVVFQGFDFAQALLPASVSTIGMSCVNGDGQAIRGVILRDCTININACSSGIYAETTKIAIGATRYATMINTVVNVTAIGDDDENYPRELSVGCAFNADTCTNSAVNLIVSGRFGNAFFYGISSNSGARPITGCQVSIDINLETFETPATLPSYYVYGVDFPLNWRWSNNVNILNSTIDIVASVPNGIIQGVLYGGIISNSALNIDAQFTYAANAYCVGVQECRSFVNSKMSIMHHVIAYHPDPYAHIGFPRAYNVRAIGAFECDFIDTSTINVDWIYLPPPGGERVVIKCPAYRIQYPTNIIDSDLSDGECYSVLTSASSFYAHYRCEVFSTYCFGGE